MEEDNQHIRRECENCVEHGLHTLKLGQLCQWKTDHDAGTKRWRSKMEEEHHQMELRQLTAYNNLEKKIDTSETKFSKYFAVNLTGVVLMLLALIGNLVFALVSKTPTGGAP